MLDDQQCQRLVGDTSQLRYVTIMIRHNYDVTINMIHYEYSDMSPSSQILIILSRFIPWQATLLDITVLHMALSVQLHTLHTGHSTKRKPTT